MTISNTEKTEQFARYASIPTQCNRLEEEEHHKEDFRNESQHDRDRILHSAAFRRLNLKTQVIFSSETDHSRTRLTHSLEVAQMAESIAKELKLNTFLTNAIALGHDLGHAPFGHAGEKELDTILKEHRLPGFRHNYQSLLIVNKLEKRYGKNNGLNLCRQTRDGILKHTTTHKSSTPIEIIEYDKHLNTHENPSTLEGQIVRAVDEIAQRAHDTEDGLRTSRISIANLIKQPMIKELFKEDDHGMIMEDFDRCKNQIIPVVSIRIIKLYIRDLFKNSEQRIKSENFKSADDVSIEDSAYIDFSDEFRKKDETYKKYLSEHFYQHHEIKRMDSRGAYFIRKLFNAFKKNPKQMPKDVYDQYKASIQKLNGETTNKHQWDQSKCEDRCLYNTNSKMSCPFAEANKPACDCIRVIINQIAGMTDRYADMEYKRLFLPPDY